MRQGKLNSIQMHPHWVDTTPYPLLRLPHSHLVCDQRTCCYHVPTIDCDRFQDYEPCHCLRLCLLWEPLITDDRGTTAGLIPEFTTKLRLDHSREYILIQRMTSNRRRSKRFTDFRIGHFSIYQHHNPVGITASKPTLEPISINESMRQFFR